MDRESLSRPWSNQEFVRRYHKKTLDQFFETEIYFISKIANNLSSTLDIGCASGRFSSFMEEYGFNGRYTGIDFCERNIEQAIRSYPGHIFLCQDALSYDLDETYDLVNATGVFQHEPRYSDLLQKMLLWSKRYVLFDLKMFSGEDHIIDREKSYRSTNGSDPPLFFNIHSVSRFVEDLKYIDGLQLVEIYGYPTVPNCHVKLPENVGSLFSAGVLIEKGHGNISEFVVHLPESCRQLVDPNICFHSI